MTFIIEDLLHPISDHKPCGEDFSFSNEFHDIKKAKTQDDLLLDQGDWITAPKQADWVKVSDTSFALLTDKTKDIRLLTWLCEAQAHLAGFDGVAKTILLSQHMLEQYWQTIHPEIEDDDLDQRLGLLQGLVNQIPSLVKKVPLVDKAPHYCFLEYEGLQHQQNNRLKKQDDAEYEEQPSLLEPFEQALHSSTATFQQQNYASFSLLITQWEAFKQTLDTLLGLDAPSFAQIDSQLESMHLTLKKLYKIDAWLKQQAQASSQSTLVPEQTMSHQPINAEHSAVGLGFQPLAQSHQQNREHAIEVLKEIAEYFQKNEPHSPVSYMLQRTIKWSDMPLHEWLAQVIKNDQPLESIQELLGVQQRNESGEW